MAVKLSDGTVIDTTDISRLLAIVAERSKGHNPATVEQPANIGLGLGEKAPAPIDLRIEQIRSRDGVTVKVGNLQLKKKTEQAGDHESFIEVLHKGWTIRVWIYRREEMFGCNVFRDSGKICRYFEFSQGDYRDENAVFKIMTNHIDGGGLRDLE